MNFPITSSEEYQDEQKTPFEFALLVFVYATIMALTIKLMGFCDAAAGDGEAESSRLLSKEAARIMYGVFEEEEEESVGRSGSSSSEDLFDGKVCAICYDKRRSWLFVPCGHCATCSSCTKRIIEGKSKTCPFCRGFIHKVSRFLKSPMN